MSTLPVNQAPTCTHPLDRQFWWMAYDDTLCGGCCDCGAVLAGAVDESNKATDEAGQEPS